MPFPWSVAPVPSFWLVLSLVLMTLWLAPNLLQAASRGKTETLPVQKAAPAAVVIETAGTEPELRRLMREKNGVAELQASVVRFSEAAAGSYGFILPKPLALALITQSPDLMLERSPGSFNAYEIHKLADGNGMVVGFLGKEVASQVKAGQRPKSIRLSLYSNLSEKAPVIAAVPLTKLMVDQMPRRIESSQPDGPVSLEMDLQATANRKPLGE